VRAAFTREAIRDFYDLDRLLDAGADLSSPEFMELVDPSGRGELRTLVELFFLA
jgi:hypothetical protein